MYGNRYEDDEDRPMPSATGTYKIPDRDFYRKNFNTFSSVYLHFQNKLYVRRFEDRRILQPHFSALVNVQTPYGNISNPADGVCTHFLRRGFTKPNKVQFNAAVWSSDARWLVLGTQTGDLALWEGEALKVHKVMSIPAHKEFFGDGVRVKEQFPITAMAWKHHGNILVSGDSRGLIQYCDEAFHNVVVTKEAHIGAVRGLSFSPLDSKLVSCG
jgi:WD40 repeat protein